MELSGTYQQRGAYLHSETLVLIIGTRHKPTANKPKYYLLAKGRGEGRQPDKWISSIYPMPDSDGLYSFDYAGRQYKLTISPESGQAVIQESSIR